MASTKALSRVKYTFTDFVIKCSLREQLMGKRDADVLDLLAIRIQGEKKATTIKRQSMEAASAQAGQNRHECPWEWRRRMRNSDSGYSRSSRALAYWIDISRIPEEENRQNSGFHEGMNQRFFKVYY